MTRGSVVLVAALALAGTALAQSAPPAAQWHGHHEWKDAAQWRQKMEQRRLDRLTLLLDLTPAQRQQVQAIFSDERARMKTALQQVRQAMEQAHAAHEAMRKDAEHRLSSVLSPIQMRKLRALMPRHDMMMHEMMMHRMMMHAMDHGMDHGMGPPPGP